MLRLLALMILFAFLPGCTSTPDTSESPAPAADTSATVSEPDNVLTIVYLGDSLTAGYGLSGGETQAYPALIEARADSLGWDVRTVNAGVSGDTSAGGLRRIEWIASRQHI